MKKFSMTLISYLTIFGLLVISTNSLKIKASSQNESKFLTNSKLEAKNSQVQTNNQASNISSTQPKSNPATPEVGVNVQKILTTCLDVNKSIYMIPQCVDHILNNFKSDVQAFAVSISKSLIKGDPSIDYTRSYFTTLFNKASEVNFMDGGISVNCAQLLNDSLKSNKKLMEEIENHKTKILNRPNRSLGTSGNLIDLVLSIHRDQGLIRDHTFAYLNNA